MRAVVQRVSRATVTADGEVIGEIGRGLLVLVAAAPGDAEADAEALADKLVGLRIFRDDAGKMNRSVVEVGGSVLVVSQFTLYAEVRRGRRPSFVGAAPPEVAEPLLEAVVRGVAARGVSAAAGRFGAMMEVSLVNDGPVTLVIEVEGGSIR